MRSVGTGRSEKDGRAGDKTASIGNLTGDLWEANTAKNVCVAVLPVAQRRLEMISSWVLQQ